MGARLESGFKIGGHSSWNKHPQLRNRCKATHTQLCISDEGTRLCSCSRHDAVCYFAQGILHSRKAHLLSRRCDLVRCETRSTTRDKLFQRHPMRACLLLMAACPSMAGANMGFSVFFPSPPKKLWAGGSPIVAFHSFLLYQCIDWVAGPCSTARTRKVRLAPVSALDRDGRAWSAQQVSTR